MTRDSRFGRTFVLILLTATAAVVPILLFGAPHGHDLEYHIPSWMEAARQFREGIPFPRWAAGAGFGYGAPFFIFYPPLSWMTGGALGLLLPWKMVPGVYIWITLVLAGIAMWKCAGDFLDPSDAAMAGLFYAVNPYLLVMVYKRSAFGEALASAFFPLLVWAVLRLRRDARSAVLPLAVAFAAIWLANLPAAVIATYALAWLLLVLCLLQRSWRPLIAGGTAAAGGLGMAAFVWVPALWERSWVNIREVAIPAYRPENNFLFARGGPGVPVSSFGHNLSLLAIFLISAAAAAVFLASRLQKKDRDVWILLAALAGLSAFMMFPPSLILWRRLPELRFAQFPSRWLSFVCVALALLASSAISQVRRKWILWLAVGLAVVAIAGTIVRAVWWDSGAVSGYAAAVSSGAGYGGATEYSPLDSRPYELPKDEPRLAFLDPSDKSRVSGVQAQMQEWSPERRVFSMNSPQPLLVRVKLLAYPAWRASVNGKQVAIEADAETKEVLLSVPAGFSQSEILFVRTQDRTLGLAVSLASALALLTLPLYGRPRRGRPE